MLEFHGDGRLAGGGEAGEPDREASLVSEGGALRVRDGAGVVGYVAVSFVLGGGRCIEGKEGD